VENYSAGSACVSGRAWVSGAIFVVRRRSSSQQAGGSLIVLPGGAWRFHWAKSGESVSQVNAIGPLGLEYHDPGDDPRGSGREG
jgi:hypothetical protein